PAHRRLRQRGGRDWNRCDGCRHRDRGEMEFDGGVHARSTRPYIACHTVSTIWVRMTLVAMHRIEIRRSRQQSRDRIVAAATELLRCSSYALLTVDEVMREAGFGRTIFYRHFDDLADLLLRASREAIDELYEAQRGFSQARIGGGPDVVP